VYKVSDNSWYTSPASYQKMRDYHEVAVPTSQWSDSNSYNFLDPTSQVFASAHVTAAPWHPDGLWVTNYGNSAELDAAGREQAPKSFPKIRGNSQNTLRPEWQPLKKEAFPKSINDYETRINQVCPSSKYNPYNTDQHWPLQKASVAVAGTYGHVYKNRGIEVPNAHFATDLVQKAVLGVFGGSDLHEGLDINWTYHEEFVEPAYRGIYGDIPEEYCYGTDLLVEDATWSLSCSDPMVNLCGDDALGGCNPAERIENKALQDCNSSVFTDCGCDSGGLFGAICTFFSCGLAPLHYAGKCVVAGFEAAVTGYESYLLSPLCLAVAGQSCNKDSLVVYKKSDGAAHHEMEIELEHRMSWLKIDGQDRCVNGFSGTCSFENYQQGNAIWPGTYPSISNEDELSTKDHLFVRGKDFQPLGNFIKNKQPPIREQPWVLAPGIMHDRFGSFEKVATTFGNMGILPAAPGYVLSILPEEIAIERFGKSFNNFEYDRGFRVQFLGDSIIDCGHHPLRSEIHPPTNIVMHLGKVANNTERYSVFAWKRSGLASSDTAVVWFDLWTGVRPGGAMQPKVVQIFPTNPDKEKGQIICEPYPQALPNRMRCTLEAGSNPQFSCPSQTEGRMLPSCTNAVSGGLFDVSWQ
jgi:hypothetical protein